MVFRQARNPCMPIILTHKNFQISGSYH